MNSVMTATTEKKSQKWEVLCVISSFSQSDVEYEIRRGGDGRIYCTCPAWRFGRGKSCKHLKLYEEGFKVQRVEEHYSQEGVFVPMYYRAVCLNCHAILALGDTEQQATADAEVNPHRC